MTRTRRRFLTIAGATALAGCLGESTGDDGQSTRTSSTRGGATGTGTGTTTTGPAPETSSVDLLLNWKPNGLHVPYYAAKGEGLFAEAGFDEVRIESGDGSTFSAKQVGLGNTPFGITSADQALNVNTRGLSPRAVAVVMQRSPVVVFTARERFGEEFTDLEQLRGKTVGTGPGMVRQVTRFLLERQGVLEDVTLADSGYSTVQQLLDGEIDAAGGVFGDAIAAAANGYETDSVRAAEFVPSYGHVVVTNPEFASNNPRTVRAFLRAVAHGAVWADRNPEAAVDHLVAENGALSETRDVERRKWSRMTSGFMLSETVRRDGWGHSSPEPWRVTYDVLSDADLLGGSVDPTTVWTNEYLPEASRYVASYADLVSG